VGAYSMENYNFDNWIATVCVGVIIASFYLQNSSIARDCI
jgi:hypothetical protein